MPVPQSAELHHSSGARFMSGNRVYRIVILGQGGVGKSALTLQFVTHTFHEDHVHIIDDAYQKQAVIDGHVGILEILDNAEHDEFPAIREHCIRGGEGFILVYTVTEQRSFQEVRKFKEMIDRVRNYEKVPIVIVGNKKDLESRRQVSTKEGEMLAKSFNCPFFETSAALRHNVDETFTEIVRCIRKKENDDYFAAGGKGAGSAQKSENRNGFLGNLLCCFGKGEES